MEPLIEEAWRLYQRTPHPPVVQPSIPILYFGDTRRYAASPLKIITVGLNPSRREFPEGDCFARFPQAAHVHPGILSGQLYADYLNALNDYFRRDPLRQWFNAFEPMLNGMEGSYYDGRPNAVLHTDLCSPLATHPTWSGLTKEATADLKAGGFPLWLRLVHHLSPDVILISVAVHHLQAVGFPPLRDWETIYTVERANPYRVEAREVEVGGGKRTLLIFGRAAEKPFGTINNLAKEKIGRRIAEYVHGR